MSRNGRRPKSPAYQWYPADAAIDDTYRLLDDAERGNFHTLYDFAWMNDGIPADLESIAALLGRPLALMRRRWVRLSRCWMPHPTRPDRLVNARQERERSSQAENRERRKAAAERANEIRWSESDPNRTPIGSKSDSENVAPLPLSTLHTPDVPPASESPGVGSAPLRSKKPRAPASGPNAECIRHWEAEWARTRMGARFRVTPADGVAVAWMLEDADPPEVFRRMTAMLEDAEPWIAKNASPRTLRSKWDAYATATPGAITRPKPPPETPDESALRERWFVVHSRLRRAVPDYPGHEAARTRLAELANTNGVHA